MLPQYRVSLGALALLANNSRVEFWFPDNLIVWAQSEGPTLLFFGYQNPFGHSSSPPSPRPWGHTPERKRSGHPHPSSALKLSIPSSKHFLEKKKCFKPPTLAPSHSSLPQQGSQVLSGPRYRPSFSAQPLSQARCNHISITLYCHFVCMRPLFAACV